MKKNFRLDEKEVRLIQVNKEKKLVTVVSADLAAISFNGIGKLINILREEEGRKPLKHTPKPEKVVTISNPVKDDEFDPYIGVALALAYNLFGSKTKFRKYVKEEILKEKEEVKKEDQRVINELSANYTVQQLRGMAKERGIKGYNKLTKLELIKKISGIVI